MADSLITFAGPFGPLCYAADASAQPLVSPYQDWCRRPSDDSAASRVVVTDRRPTGTYSPGSSPS